MLTIRNMGRSDIPSGMHLKQSAGWNQTEADWRRLIDVQPDGCFLAEIDGRPVGTVTTSRFGAVGWIAMMLVDEAFRGRGIGRALMVGALEDLERHGVSSVRLDATPLGRPLYESLGFVEESVFARFEGRLPAGDAPALPTSVQPAVSLDEVLDLDRSVTATDRGRLLRRLLEDQPDSLRVVRDGSSTEGYLMSRPGSRARQIGPCIASARAGPLLLLDAACRYAGESVFLDLPTSHGPARSVAESLGLGVARLLTRMGRGPRIEEDHARLWASAGPEKG